MEMAARVGTRKVIASGLLMTRGNEGATVTLSGLNYHLRFEDTEGKKLDVIAESGDSNTLVLHLQNFDNPLGTSYWANVGTIQGRQLFLDLFVHAIGEPNKMRLVNYSFTLEGAPDV